MTLHTVTIDGLGNIDTKDGAYGADLTDANIYEEILMNHTNSMVYPNPAHSHEVPSSDQPPWGESNLLPLQTPPIQSNDGNFCPQPLAAITIDLPSHLQTGRYSQSNGKAACSCQPISFLHANNSGSNHQLW